MGRAAVRTIRALEFTCGGCGKTQIVASRQDVIGLGGKVWEATATAGSAAEWHACSRECVTAAIGKALHDAWE